MPGAAKRVTKKSQIVTRSVARLAARRLAQDREVDQANLGAKSQMVSANNFDSFGEAAADVLRPGLPEAAEESFLTISTPSLLSRAQSPQAIGGITEWEAGEGEMGENSRKRSKEEASELKRAIFEAFGLPAATQNPIEEIKCLLMESMRQELSLTNPKEGDKVKAFYSCPNLPTDTQPQRAGSWSAGNLNFAPKMAACQPLTATRDNASPTQGAQLQMPYPSGAAMPAARKVPGPSAGSLMPPATVGRLSLATPSMSPPQASRSHAQTVKGTVADRSTKTSSSPAELEIDAAIRTLRAAFGTATRLPPRPKTTQAGQECHLPPPSGSSPFHVVDEVPAPPSASSPAPRFQRGPAVPELEFLQSPEAVDLPGDALQGRPTATPVSSASSPASRSQRGPAVPELEFLQSPEGFHLPGDTLRGHPGTAPVFVPASVRSSAGTAPPQAELRTSSEERQNTSSLFKIQPGMKVTHAQEFARARKELSNLTAEKKAARFFKTAASKPAILNEGSHRQPKERKAAEGFKILNVIANCFVCGSRSHFKRECPSYFKNKIQSKGEGEKKGSLIGDKGGQSKVSPIGKKGDQSKGSHTGDKRGPRSSTPPSEPNYLKGGQGKDTLIIVSPEKVNYISGCFICGSKSHYKRECPKYHKNMPQDREEEGKESSTSDEERGQRSPSPPVKPKFWERGRNRHKSKSVCEKVNAIGTKGPKLIRKQRKQLWLLDSGANTHLISDISLFTEFKAKESKVKVANGKMAKVSGEGSVRIPGLGLVKGVLYVPEIGYNSLSTLKLTESGHIEIIFALGQSFVTFDGQNVGRVVIMDDLPYYSPRNVKDRAQERNKRVTRTHVA